MHSGSLLILKSGYLCPPISQQGATTQQRATTSVKAIIEATNIKQTTTIVTQSVIIIASYISGFGNPSVAIC